MGRRIGSLLILNGADSSQWQELRHVDSLSVQAPATLDGGTTYKLQVSNDGGTTIFDVPSGAIVASQIVVVAPCPYGAVRVLASGNVGADRNFQMAAVEVSTPL